MKTIIIHRLLTFILLAFICMSCKQTSSQVREYHLVTKVKINENDCFRCFGGNQILQQLSEVSKVELVFNGLEDNSIQRFLKVNEITLKNGINIVNDTSVYKLLNTCTLTEAHVCGSKGEVYITFPFKFGPNIDDVISEMQLLNEGLYFEQHPNKIDIEYKTGMIKLLLEKNHIVVLNCTMNICEVFDKKGSKLFQIDASNLDPVSFFPEMSELESVTNYLKSSGVFSCRIEKAICNEEEILFLVSVPYVEMHNDSIIQEVFPCIVSYILDDENNNPKVLYSSRKIIIEDIIVPSSKSQFDLQCIGVEVGQDYETIDYFIHSMKLNDGSLQIVESKRIDYPSFDRMKSFNHEPKIKDGLFALGYTDYLYDLERDIFYTLPMKCNLSMEGQSMTNLMIKSNGHVVDWSFDGKDLSIIYYDEINRECKCLYLKKGTKDFSIIPLSFGGKLKCPYLYMVSPRVFYYLNLENEICAKVINTEFLQIQ